MVISSMRLKRRELEVGEAPGRGEVSLRLERIAEELDSPSVRDGRHEHYERPLRTRIALAPDRSIRIFVKDFDIMNDGALGDSTIHCLSPLISQND
jgi:hypothetical protein